MDDKIVKYVALGFLAFLAVASVIVYGYDTFNNIMIPGIIQSIIAAAVGYALHALGVQAGSVTTLNGVHAEAAKDAANSANAQVAREATYEGYAEGKATHVNTPEINVQTGRGIPMGPPQQ